MKYLTYKNDSDRNDISSNNNNRGICHLCRYSIQELRTYIWAGQRYPVGDPKAGQPIWCFGFGEKNWVDGKKFSKVKNDAEGDLLAIPPIVPIGRVDCVTGVLIP